MKYLYNNSTGCIVMCNMPKKNNLKITNMVMGSVHPVIIINVTGTDLNLEYEIYYINNTAHYIKKTKLQFSVEPYEYENYGSGYGKWYIYDRKNNIKSNIYNFV